MRDDTRDMESQFDAMLAGWADDFDRFPEPNAAVVERVKSAVRHEMNEQWLTAYGTPLPSDDAVGEVRQAVRDELDRSIRPLVWSRWLQSRGVAGLAAAALVAVCVGLIQQVGSAGSRRAGTSVEPLMVARAHVDLFVEAAQYTLAEDEFVESVLDELQSIDEKLVGSSGEPAVESVLDELDGALQDILDEAAPADATMGSTMRLPEVLG